MFMASLLCLALLVIADLLRTNRIILEENLERIKHLQYDRADPHTLDVCRPNVRCPPAGSTP